MKKGRRLGLPSIGREGRISTVRKPFILWRLAWWLINRYRRRARGPAAGGGLFPIVFLLYIVCRLRKGVEVHGILLTVPHDKVARRQQILYCAAIAAVGDAQSFLYISGAEGKRETILVAAQVKIQTQGCTR